MYGLAMVLLRPWGGGDWTLGREVVLEAYIWAPLLVSMAGPHRNLPTCFSPEMFSGPLPSS